MISVPVWLSRLPVGSSASKSLRTVDQRPRQSRPLLFATGKFDWADDAFARSQSHALQSLTSQASALAAIDLRKPQRKLDVFCQRHAGDQIERLENHAHDVQTILGEFFARKLGEIAILHDDASRGRAIQSGDQIQHGRFAGAGTPEKRNEFSGREPRVKRHPPRESKSRPCDSAGKDFQLRIATVPTH